MILRPEALGLLVYTQIIRGVAAGLEQAQASVSKQANPEEALESTIHAVSSYVFASLNELLDLGPGPSSGEAQIQNDGTTKNVTGTT